MACCQWWLWSTSHRHIAPATPQLGIVVVVLYRCCFLCCLQGWDKTYCLQYLLKDGYSDIHFFGDKTFEGGNDFEIYSSDLTTGHTTTGPADTVKQCTELFLASA